MPAESTASGSPRSKPSTRSSLRNTLGKAFADVINKDSRDSDKSGKKAKDASSRRLSTVNLKPAAPRASMGDTRPPSQVSKRVATPESKTITRRRASAAAQRSSSDEQPPKSSTESATPQGTGVSRSASLRPRTANSAMSSALPKYRPKSALMEVAKPPPSPVRAGTRRRLSTSDEEKEDPKKAERVPTPADKVSRPISPLPHRTATKTSSSMLTNTTNVTPNATPSKVKPPTPSTSRASPTRPTKILKTVTTAPVSAAQSAIPRPGSSSSSSNSFTPHTPKTPSVRHSATIQKSASAQGKSLSRASPTRGSPTRGSPLIKLPESPLARHSRISSKNSTPSASASSSSHMGNMSHISEGNSEDSEEDDVELLLAPIANLGAPTPAMPRIQASRSRKRLAPQTPTRSSSLLPSRANLSYLSPLPPDRDESSSLRPPSQKQPGSDRAARGSILSWEQLASEASRTLGEDDIENMLSEIPAPFRSGAVSPSPSTSHIDIPESPCLSAMSSPGGYGSISQVLLPDVTPSPAIHHHNASRYDMSPEAPVVDAAIVTLLRLQLASAENMAKERLYQLQKLEEEIHNLKAARTLDAQELLSQVNYMEDQVRGKLEARGREDEERAAYTASLQDQLRHMMTYQDQAVQEALAKAQKAEVVKRQDAVRLQRQRCDAACSAHVAMAEWTSVREVSEGELDIVRADREVLAVLLSELNRAQELLF